jgi:hypothetical protein
MMYQQATFIFYNELNDFLPRRQRGKPVGLSFRGRQTVKHLIESLGVPHTEVEALLVNGNGVGFEHLTRDNDRVEVFPPSGVTPSMRYPPLRPPLNGYPRFVLDNHLGRLAAYLRLMGFDSLYRNDYQDETLAQIAGEEQRILLTRDHRLLQRRQVVYGYWVRATQPRRQILEVTRRFQLTQHARPFHRCLLCNGLLSPVPKAEILDKLEPKTRIYYHKFRRCQSCGQIFWKGSHFERLQKLIDDILQEG